MDIQPKEPDEVLQGFLLPGGKQVPFCAYNTIGYREQARAQLEAQEPERRKAKAGGRRYEPQPITFNFERANQQTIETALRIVE